MSDRDDTHPELAGYEPGDGRPLRHPLTLKVMRIVVILAIAGLILPTVFSTVSTNISTASRACDIVVAQQAPDAVSSAARFELLSQPDGPGWYCYAVGFDGREVLLQFLGAIPEIRRAPVDTGDQDA